MEKIFVVGLTGQTGAGKSTVSRLIRARGLTVIDCDETAHTVVEQDKTCLAELAMAFSIAILNADGSLNRRRLGDMVFGKPEKLRQLDEIVFPHICTALNERLLALQREGCPLAVLDAPTLFESGMNSRCDAIVSVVAPREQRINRIVVRDHLTDEQARRRSASQFEDSFYTEKSDLVILNDGDEQELRLKTLEMLDRLQQLVAARSSAAEPT